MTMSDDSKEGVNQKKGLIMKTRFPEDPAGVPASLSASPLCPKTTTSLGPESLLVSALERWVWSVLVHMLSLLAFNHYGREYPFNQPGYDTLPMVHGKVEFIQ